MKTRFPAQGASFPVQSLLKSSKRDVQKHCKIKTSLVSSISAVLLASGSVPNFAPVRAPNLCSGDLIKIARFPRKLERYEVDTVPKKAEVS